MSIDEYLKFTTETAIYPDRVPDDADSDLIGLFYCVTKLCGESGEVAEQIGKALRDDGGIITDERRQKILLEIGDVHYYLARLCSHMGMRPSEVLDMNAAKLRDRKARGVLGGSGSDR